MGETEQFAKLFETAEGQLLVTLCDTAEEEPGMKFRAASVGGITAEIEFAYDTDEEQARAFAAVDQNGAEEAARTLRSAIRRLTGKPEQVTG